MILYSYWRSTTAYRVRIALNLKGIDYKTRPVNLIKGDQFLAEYTRINPSRGVPALQIDRDTVLTQSMAILSYLDAIVPNPPLLPDTPINASRVNAAAAIIACDIHPVNNLKVITRLKSQGFDDAAAKEWMNHWMHNGLTAYQALIEPTGKYSFGDTLSLADICLVPQIYNARRWELDMSPFKRLLEIDQNCAELEAFDTARPENQPDSI